MSIRSAVSGFFDKIVDARFKRDPQGRLMFFPWGFGTGRLVSDAQTEARLRRATWWMMVLLFVVAIPGIAGYSSAYHPAGKSFIPYFLGCVALGYAFQIYPAWLARNLPRADVRMSYVAMMVQSLDRFGRKFLIFGLVMSIAFVLISVVMLVMVPADLGTDPLPNVITLLVFAPMAAVYALALKRRRANEGRTA